MTGEIIDGELIATPLMNLGALVPFNCLADALKGVREFRVCDGNLGKLSV
jgi:hypothetical protein